jgi:hypothetical protein
VTSGKATVSTQRLPELGQGPDIAKSTRCFKSDGWWRRNRWRRGGHLAADLHQALNHGIQLTVDLIQPPQCGDGTLFDLSGIIPVGLHKLDIAAAAGGGYLHMHAATLSAFIDMSIKEPK